MKWRDERLSNDTPMNANAFTAGNFARYKYYI